MTGSRSRNLDFVDSSIRFHFQVGDPLFAEKIGELLADLWGQGELDTGGPEADTMDVIRRVSEKAVLVALAALREQGELPPKDLSTAYFDRTYLIRSV